MNPTSVLRRSAWLAWLLLIVSGGGLALMIGDDDPPFRLIGYTVEPVRPGGVLRVTADVQRDLDRECSVVFSRHMFDSLGTRIDLAGTRNMTADAIRVLDEVSPGKLRLALPIPAYAAAGPAKLVTPLSYQCNAWHAMRPIETTTVMVFEVSP